MLHLLHSCATFKHSKIQGPFPSTVSSSQKQVQNAHMQQTRDQMYERTVGYLKAERLHTKVNSKEISTWKVHNPRGHYLRVVSVEKGTWWLSLWRQQERRRHEVA